MGTEPLYRTVESVQGYSEAPVGESSMRLWIEYHHFVPVVTTLYYFVRAMEVMEDNIAKSRGKRLDMAQFKVCLLVYQAYKNSRIFFNAHKLTVGSWSCTFNIQYSLFDLRFGFLLLTLSIEYDQNLRDTNARK